MTPRESEVFVAVGRKRGLIHRQLESFAAVKARREQRTVAEVLAGSLPADAVAAIQSAVDDLAFACAECGLTDWDPPDAPPSEVCRDCSGEAPPEVARAEPAASEPARSMAAGAPSVDEGAEESLDDFLAREGALELDVFCSRHRGVFLFREADGEARIVRLASPVGGARVTIGAGPECDVRLGGGPLGSELAPLAAIVERLGDGTFSLVAGDEWIVVDSRRLAPGARVRLEEGWSVRLGKAAVYTAFSPGAFFRFLGFRDRLARARGEA